MKKQLLLLLAVCLAISGMQAASFTSATVLVEGNQISFPASGMDMDVLEEPMPTFILDGFLTTVSGNVTAVSIKGSLYKDGGTAENWKEIPGSDRGNGEWGLTGLNFDIIEGEDDGKTFIFEFYFEGKDNSGNSFYYNNGGNNYKVKFTKTSTGAEKVTFIDASINLTIDNNRSLTYTYSSPSQRTPSDQIGELSNLRIDGFSLHVNRQSGVNLDDVSLQYKIYPQGKNDGSWNGIPSTNQTDVNGDKFNKLFWNDKAFIEIDTDNLVENVSYVLEVNFQLIDRDGNYYIFGKDSLATKFIFSKKKGGQGGEQGNRFDVNQDGTVNVSDVTTLINHLLGIEQ